MNLPAPDFAALVDEGIAHHRAGRLPQAVAVYARVLNAAPNHADALHLLGLAAHQFDKKEEALALVTRAVQLRPDVAGYHNSQGIILVALGRTGEATRAFQHALHLDPSNGHARANLARLDPSRAAQQSSLLPVG